MCIIEKFKLYLLVYELVRCARFCSQTTAADICGKRIRNVGDGVEEAGMVYETQTKVISEEVELKYDRLF